MNASDHRLVPFNNSSMQLSSKKMLLSRQMQAHIKKIKRVQTLAQNIYELLKRDQKGPYGFPQSTHGPAPWASLQAQFWQGLAPPSPVCCLGQTVARPPTEQALVSEPGGGGLQARLKHIQKMEKAKISVHIFLFIARRLKLFTFRKIGMSQYYNIDRY